MIIFNETTRELTSDTTYILCNSTNIPYNYSIYLGIYDSQDNYKEITKTEYNKRIKEIEEENKLLEGNIYGKDNL